MKEGKVIAKKDITTAQNNYMGSIEPGTPITTVTLTCLGRFLIFLERKKNEKERKFLGVLVSRFFAVLNIFYRY